MRTKRRNEKRQIVVDRQRVGKKKKKNEEYER